MLYWPCYIEASRSPRITHVLSYKSTTLHARRRKSNAQYGSSNTTMQPLYITRISPITGSA
eukprot:20505-Eustigmatos_ZCMA.PRE.1